MSKITSYLEVKIEKRLYICLFVILCLLDALLCTYPEVCSPLEHTHTDTIISFLVLDRNPPLWGTMKYQSEKFPKDTSSKVRINRDLYSYEK